jgi:hypothetical protein
VADNQGAAALALDATVGLLRDVAEGRAMFPEVPGNVSLAKLLNAAADALELAEEATYMEHIAVNRLTRELAEARAVGAMRAAAPLVLDFQPAPATAAHAARHASHAGWPRIEDGLASADPGRCWAIVRDHPRLLCILPRGHDEPAPPRPQTVAERLHAAADWLSTAGASASLRPPTPSSSEGDGTGWQTPTSSDRLLGRACRTLYAHDRSTRGHGRVVGYTDEPTVLVEYADGSRETWLRHLTEPVVTDGD